jgi:hypothetical protein
MAAPNPKENAMQTATLTQPTLMPENLINSVPSRAAEKAMRASRAAKASRSSGRRHGIDPTTCERDYTTEEVEFMNAIQEYKKRSGRMFPTWSEVLEVVRDLGYEKMGKESN